jgi:hypothetical protein
MIRKGNLLRRAGTVLAAAALALVGVASAAHADDRLLDTDHVNISSSGFYFGDGTWAFSGYDKDGKVKWMVDENDVTPSVTGKLALFAVENECARMRLDYYTSSDTLLATRYGGTVCAPTNGINEWSVDLSPYTSDQTRKLKVSVEHQLSNLTWAIVNSQTVSLNTYVDDQVDVSYADGTGVYGIGFGGSAWSGGQTSDYGTVTWTMSGGQIRPHLVGYLHAESAAGDCLRMRLDYYADNSVYLYTLTGGTVCANDNSHYRWSVDLDGYAADSIQHVRISIERANGLSYTVIDSTTSYFGT